MEKLDNLLVHETSVAVKSLSYLYGIHRLFKGEYGYFTNGIFTPVFRTIISITHIPLCSQRHFLHHYIINISTEYVYVKKQAIFNEPFGVNHYLIATSVVEIM